MESGRADAGLSKGELVVQRVAAVVDEKRDERAEERGEFAEKERRDQRFLGRCDWD